MEKRGYVCEVTEHWNAFARKRKDLWGFADVICLGDPGPVAVVQSTSASNVSARIAKIAASPLVGAVRKAGVRIFVHGWRKVKGRWQVREVDVS